MVHYQRIVTEFLDENAYILYNDNKECIIIDPGFGFELINSFITSNHLKPLAILATHAHFDHIASAYFFIKEYDIDFYLCQDERLILENFEKAANFWGIGNVGSDIVVKRPQASHWINNDEKNLTIGSFNFLIIFNPGHSPGSISFVIEDLVFCGDLIFRGSIGRTDLPLSSPRDMSKSLEFFVNSFTSDCKLLTGHGEETTLYEELRTNPYLIKHEK